MHCPLLLKKKKKVTQKRGVILILVYIKMNTEEIQLIRHKNCSHNNSQALSIFTRVSFPLLRSWYAVVMLSEEAFFYHLLLQYTFDYCWVTLCGLNTTLALRGERRAAQYWWQCITISTNAIHVVIGSLKCIDTVC